MSIEVLTNKNEFLHAVTIMLIPIALEHRVLRHHLHKFFLRHGGIERTCLLEIELLTGLLKKIAHVILLFEIAHSFAADDILIPMACHEFVKSPQIKWTTTVIDESGDTILIAMVVVMVVTTAMRIITLVTVVMMMLVAMTMGVMAFTMFVVVMVFRS